MKAVRTPGQVIAFLGGCVLLTGLDQWTKAYVCSRAAGHVPESGRSAVLIPHVARMHYIENNGMAFGLFAGGRIFFLAVFAVMLLAAAYWFLTMPQGKGFRITAAGLTLFCGGAVGNAIDRIRLGYVVDFISLIPVSFPVFNLADLMVVSGCILLAVRLCFFSDDAAAE